MGKEEGGEQALLWGRKREARVPHKEERGIGADEYKGEVVEELVGFFPNTHT